MAEAVVIALDVGGSSVKSGIVTHNQTVEAIMQTSVDSKGSAETILATFAGIVTSYLARYPDILGVGIGFPSPFDYDNGISLIEGVDKYETIFNVDVGADIRVRVNQPNLKIRFRNDAESALVGEALYGAGSAYSRFIGLTLGTGLGSSFMADGQRVKDGQGVPDSGFLFPVHYRGVQSDEWFSTRGLLKRFTDAGTPFTSVADAAQAAQTDDNIRATFAAFGADLAEFVQPHLASFHAEALLITGGIANAYDLFRDGLENGVSVPVVRGTLGTQAALLGAADLIYHEKS
ncbi:MAG: ROK family protein [Phototrophicaceae bacterium]